MELRIPRLSPFGHIEYDVNDFTQIQVFDDRLPALRRAVNPIHDHTYDFLVRVVEGVYKHTAYDFTTKPTGDIRLFGTQPWSCGDFIPLPGMVGELAVFEAVSAPRGFSVPFHAGWFHEVGHEGLTVVVVTKTRRNVMETQRIVGDATAESIQDFPERLLPSDYLGVLAEGLKYVEGEVLYAS